MNATSHPLEAFRAREKLTLDQLAQEIGVKRNTIWRWENGRMPRQNFWKSITKVTGVQPQDLLPFVKQGKASAK